MVEKPIFQKAIRYCPLPANTLENRCVLKDKKEYLSSTWIYYCTDNYLHIIQSFKSTNFLWNLKRKWFFWISWWWFDEHRIYLKTFNFQFCLGFLYIFLKANVVWQNSMEQLALHTNVMLQRFLLCFANNLSLIWEINPTFVANCRYRIVSFPQQNTTHHLSVWISTNWAWNCIHDFWFETCDFSEEWFKTNAIQNSFKRALYKFSSLHEVEKVAGSSPIIRGEENRQSLKLLRT